MKTFDFLIVGSGFSGSITAMALVKCGYSVCLVEKEEHPRFAIGESSTPIADMILRDLADDYDLPFLKKLSRYGEWQKSYPEIICGLKRGFSYYQHKKGERFVSDKYHSNELLVAASEDDLNSDTNWLRSDIDHFLVKKATEIGVIYLDQTEVQKLSRKAKKQSWSVSLKTDQRLLKIESDWIIDASGSPDFSTMFLNTQSTSKGFKTNSSAIFTHFENVDYWSEYLSKNGFKTSDYPFSPDDSALHHLIDEGWVWMLRFNNHRLSAGMLLDGNHQTHLTGEKAKGIWNSVIRKYPSLKEIFINAVVADSPGQIFKTRRLQRRLNQLYGNGWVVLPHTAGFVDPLHSTGIAHTLSGVETILKLFNQKMGGNPNIKFKQYQDKVFTELAIIDLLVSICYQTRGYPGLFSASTMVYFIASIKYEQNRLKGDIPDTFLCADKPEIQELVQQTFDDIQKLNLISLGENDFKKQVEKIRMRIEPYNSMGLMDPRRNNMYKHTAVKL